MSINIFGVVGEDVRAADVLEQIQAEKGKVIEVTIMSPGGSVLEGLAIYDALRAASNKGQEIKTSALGMAASIASIIFMAGDQREVSDNAEIMIHNAHVMTGGNKNDLKGAIEKLNGMDKKLIDIYTDRTDLSVEEVTALLDKETFMSADVAISKGFATAKADVLALVAIHNKTKEPVNMADEKKEDEKSMLNKLMAYLKGEIKAEELPEKEDDAAEEAKAEGDEDEKPDFEAENIALKAELEELKAKAEGDEEEKKEMEAKAEEDEEAKAEHEEEEKKEEEAKALAIFNATVVNKITLVEAKNLLSKSVSFVTETLEGKAVNATGLAKTEVPKKDVVNHYETWTAMLKTSTAKAQAYYVEHSDDIAKEK